MLVQVGTCSETTLLVSHEAAQLSVLLLLSHAIEPHHEKIIIFHMRKQRRRSADQRLCFRYRRVFPFLYFLNLKFVASSLLCAYSSVCVGPVQKPHCWVLMWWLICTADVCSFLDHAYQYWSRFGIDQTSLLYLVHLS